MFRLCRLVRAADSNRLRVLIGKLLPVEDTHYSTDLDGAHIKALNLFQLV